MMKQYVGLDVSQRETAVTFSPWKLRIRQSFNNAYFENSRDLIQPLANVPSTLDANPRNFTVEREFEKIEQSATD